MDMQDKLFMTSYKIGSMEVPNRICMAPMGTKADPDGGFCVRDLHYYEERAKGGTGLIITGRVAATEKYEMRSHHVLDNYHQVGRLSILAERIHRYGSKLCIQIGPGVGRTQHVNPFTPPYSASAIPSYYYPELICKPYTVEQIHDLTWAMGYTAALCRRAGADSVEIHAYGGYLLDQFHSTLWNKRTDAYGGSLRNRLRFTTECMEQIKEQAGADFPVIVKYTANHHMEGGRTIEEGIEMAKIFEECGADGLHVDGGCIDYWHKQIPSVYEPRMLLAEDVAAVKAAVNIPVIGHGKIHTVDEVETVLKKGQMDLVAMGHQMLADPYWVKKATSGRSYDIRPCIGCNECVVRSHMGRDHSCAVNPRCLREDDYRIVPAEVKKRVLVVGGGPSGMEAAIVAAERGHQVQLWEGRDVLGGLLIEAGAPSFKSDVVRYKDYMVGKVYRSGIQVILDKTATIEDIQKGGFDGVILATGAKRTIPPIPGHDNALVTESLPVLNGTVSVGQKVAVIGGGLVGCELALDLRLKGKDVTILEMMPGLIYKPATKGYTTKNPNDDCLREMLADANVKAVVNAAVSRITDDSVLYTQNGQSGCIPCDTVVMAAGFKIDHTLEEGLKNAGIRYLVAGNAHEPGLVYEAVHEGFFAGLDI